MLIEQPPLLLRWIYPRALWRMDKNEKAVYLTFDDGPIPNITPWVLDLLDQYGIKATFFMVGDNVRKHPEEFRMVVERGHRIGNHTFNQYHVLKKKYRIVMWDLVTRDYSKRLTGPQVLAKVKKYARNGSIITFHDSIKSEPRLKYALPRAIEWLLAEGYTFKVF